MIRIFTACLFLASMRAKGSNITGTVLTPVCTR